MSFETINNVKSEGLGHTNLFKGPFDANVAHRLKSLLICCSCHVEPFKYQSTLCINSVFIVHIILYQANFNVDTGDDILSVYTHRTFDAFRKRLLVHCLNVAANITRYKSD